MDIACRSETICAIATPIGIGGIGIIKISGPDALTLLQKIFRPAHASFVLPPSHKLIYGWIVDPETQSPIDEVLASYMAGPRSYTGEDVVEINCHSGYVVLQRILELVLSHGARLARPGEFTLRAFLHGRLDLSQAEAVIDVIHARSEKALEAAGKQLRRGFGQQVSRWRNELLELEARLEASLDFSEDMELEGASELEAVAEQLERDILPALRRLAESYEEARVLREGLSLVLVGKPNVGKSSLLNALVGQERAIVTPVAGTTRDVIEDGFLVAGLWVRVLDTAGIREKPDMIESLGIERTLRCVDEADLVLWIVDQSRYLDADDDRIQEKTRHKKRLVILNKRDCPMETSVDDLKARYGLENAIIHLCAHDPGDIERLKRFLERDVLQEVVLGAESTFAVNVRQKECLERAVLALDRAVEVARAQGFPELVAEEVRAARSAVEEILGLHVDDAVLERIFSRFCIGK
ncbi:tRNA uridine-5-carboxymethylaminomethyl(34) synthesis GTPase MnmE [Desulfosoma caldarium]|uniref:tRNA modification GTPase MnmE n=1 Tax=Desulfosoma caldarium TaxID=610254 RepID=A0A3N1VN99_9BACT|nr:tRNA uridine-5-carboxymethylaminomethyl(34) synthesis GTPase MnmE [Desulfosoma caldarium]ROR03549.1 tRNA modification GTPase trmE [Desulfosoma caldarium]